MTTAALNTKISELGNEIPNWSGLVKKTDYDAKMSDRRKIYNYFWI